jgi:hypothetical protein
LRQDNRLFEVAAARRCGRVCRLVAMAVALLCASGCGSSGTTEVPKNLTVLQMRKFAAAYLEATKKLKHPPQSAEEFRTYYSKIGDPKELLVSPTDGAELVVAWGVDLQKYRPVGEHWPVWAYEANSHGGKRWVLELYRPMQLTNEALRSATFVSGFKGP